MLTIYIYLFFRDNGLSYAQGMPESEEATPLPSVPIESLMEEVGFAVGQGDDPQKRRFAPSFPTETKDDPQKLPEPDESGTIEEVSPVESLPFFGVAPGVAEETLPDSDTAAGSGGQDGSSDESGAGLPNVQPVDGARGVSTHFYNMPVSGNKILFILDAETGKAREDSDGVLALEKELQRVVDSLGQEVEFNIWVFSGEKMAWCYDQFLPADSGNKAYSMVWIKIQLGLEDDEFNEENKPDGYPGMYNSHSGLGWASPLFLAVENAPSAIFLVTSGWKIGKGTSFPNLANSSGWSAQNEASWQAAVSETKAWIKGENERRALQGLPPKPIFNMKQVVSRRYPEVRVPPATPVFNEDKIYNELQKRVEGAGIKGLCPIHVVIQPGNISQGLPAMNKFKSLVMPYKGGVYLIK